MSGSTSALRIGSRASQLARWQAEAVRNALLEAQPDLEVEIQIITTEGDRTLDRALPEIGGKGLFTQEIDRALRDAEIDLAVHSLKDLPTDEPEGLTIGAIPLREDPRDVLVASNDDDMNTLPAGATVGTSSPRRRAQLFPLRPDLNVAWIRGNVETRIGKVHSGEFDAVVLAAAGLLRLGLEDEITHWFNEMEMLPAPGQGAVAVQQRHHDSRVSALLAQIDDPAARAAVTAERAFLATLESGCSAPVGALGKADTEGVELVGLIAGENGGLSIRLSERGRDPISLGRRLGERALEQGAGEIVHAAE